MTRSSTLLTNLCTVVASCLLAQSCLAQSGTPFPEPVDLGAEKFPGDIFLPFAISVGFSGDTLRQGISYTIGGTSIRHTKQERATPSDDWIFMEATEDAGFIITQVASRRGGDEVFVAGLRSDGRSVIERWSYSPRPDGWMVKIELPADVIGLGDPAPPPAPTVVLNGSASWRTVSSAEKTLLPARRSVLRLSVSGPFHGLSADPQGRYLIFFDMELKKLEQLDLTSVPYQASTLIGPTHPLAVDVGGVVQVMDFDGLGRHVLIQPVLGRQAAPHFYLLGADPENDGIFNSFQRYSESDWSGSPFADWGKWSTFIKE